MTGRVRCEVVLGLFAIEGVVGSDEASASGGRGRPMMGVLTQPVKETPTCPTLPPKAALPRPT